MGCKYLTEGVLGLARKRTSLAAGAPVGRHAKRGPANRKQAAKLSRRIADFTAMNANKGYRQGQRDSKVQMRLDNNGFHRPGSFQH